MQYQKEKRNSTYRDFRGIKVRDIKNTLYLNYYFFFLSGLTFLRITNSFIYIFRKMTHELFSKICMPISSNTTHPKLAKMLPTNALFLICFKYHDIRT